MDEEAKDVTGGTKTMKSLVSGNKIILEFELGEYYKDIVDLLTMMEIASKSKATERDIEELSKEIKKNWWQRNKDSFINLGLTQKRL
ncbi:hypothetical protein FJZ31_15905 [Candidatus Poribacteria bacterium]|nr:hypothetical protein [Candidatus Poribacteria bacterium]